MLRYIIIILALIIIIQAQKQYIEITHNHTLTTEIERLNITYSSDVITSLYLLTQQDYRDILDRITDPTDVDILMRSCVDYRRCDCVKVMSCNRIDIDLKSYGDIIYVFIVNEDENKNANVMIELNEINNSVGVLEIVMLTVVGIVFVIMIFMCTYFSLILCKN
jgi:hypothetical protein